VSCLPLKWQAVQLLEVVKLLKNPNPLWLPKVDAAALCLYDSLPMVINFALLPELFLVRLPLNEKKCSGLKTYCHCFCQSNQHGVPEATAKQRYEADLCRQKRKTAKCESVYGSIRGFSIPFGFLSFYLHFLHPFGF
jgi:hypothetical protein